MNFGQAIELLKQGKKMCRSGWNGKSMWLYYVEPKTLVAPAIWTEPMKKHAEANGGTATVGGYFGFKSAQETFEMGYPKIEMLGDNVLVVPDAPVEQVGQIKLSQDAIKRQDRGVVVAAGPGKRIIDRDTMLPVDMGMKVKLGDRVVFAPQGTAEISVDGNTYLIMREEFNVLGILPA